MHPPLSPVPYRIIESFRLEKKWLSILRTTPNHFQGFALCWYPISPLTAAATTPGPHVKLWMLEEKKGGGHGHTALTMNPDHAGSPTLSSSEMPPTQPLSIPQQVGDLSRALTWPRRSCVRALRCRVWNIMETGAALQGTPTFPCTAPAFLPSCSSRCAVDGHMLASTFFHMHTPGSLMLLLTLR